MEKKIHQGRNITRFRQMLGMKQDSLASAMGDDWTQLKISRLEAKEEIEDGILVEVSKALKIPVEAIRNFDEEAALNIVANTFSDNSALNVQPTFNPVDKIVEILEKTISEKNAEIASLKKEIDKLRKKKK